MDFIWFSHCGKLGDWKRPLIEESHLTHLTASRIIYTLVLRWSLEGIWFCNKFYIPYNIPWHRSQIWDPSGDRSFRFSFLAWKRRLLNQKDKYMKTSSRYCQKPEAQELSVRRILMAVIPIQIIRCRIALAWRDVNAPCWEWCNTSWKFARSCGDAYIPQSTEAPLETAPDCQHYLQGRQ